MATAARSRHGLATYRAKRDFSKTPEPAGKRGSVRGHDYLIQKHAARRLHYDFRLQMGGVLKSWAVTRGPSLDPEDKRLAVHVEDHPLAYGGFEGIIPQGEYGGGTVMLWDKGSWAPVGDPEYGYQKGHLTFELQGERLKGRWHLVRMRKAERGKKENWLLIKGKDKYANTRDGDYALGHFQRSVTTGRSMEQIATGRSRRWSSKSGEDPAPARAKKVPVPKKKKKKKRSRSRLPVFVKPELATLAKQPPRGEGWLHEIKFDGYRLIARVQDGEVRLLTRDENDWTGRYGPIARGLAKLHHDVILDGEVVFQREDGSMSFHELQNASSAEKQAYLHYYAFDLMFLDGEDWRDRPLLERKERLQELLQHAPQNIHYSEHFQAPGDEVLAHACHIALEGIVSKRADRPYRSGRGLDWIKSKCIHEQEIVIGGYTKQAKGGSQLASLLTGYYEGGKLIYSGKVGTGFTQDEARKLLRKLEALGRDSAPFAAVPGEVRRGAYWVKPELVAQVNFGEWTPEGRMRHPSFQGLREDKPARQVVREKEQRPPPPKRTAVRGSGTRRRAKAEPTAVEGVALSHPDKLLYPEAKVTKGMLAEYYAKAAKLMLPHVAGRPISLLRCPNGVGHSCFFQRHAGEGASPHLLPVKVANHGGGEPYIMIQDVQGLIALVQSGVLEVHVWGSRADDPEHPDRLVFDFDPDPKVKFAEVKRAALEMREVLKEIGLKSFLKTTGGKGLHVVVPFQKGPTWDEAKAFSKALSDAFAKSRPGRFTINSRKAERTGKIFIDYLRNGMTASAIAPYSCRARPDATVALPLSWDELPKLKSASAFGIQEALKRLRKDPWRGMDKVLQELPIGSTERAARRR